MIRETAPAGFPIPLRIGDRIVGWVAADLAALTASPPSPAGPEALPPHLLFVPVAPEVLAVRTGRRGFVIVPQASILYVTSRGGLTTVYTADGHEPWSPLSLTALAARLDPRRFLRLDASHVVNIEQLAGLVPEAHQRYSIVFRDPKRTTLGVSRDVGRRLRAALGVVGRPRPILYSSRATSLPRWRTGRSVDA